MVSPDSVYHSQHCVQKQEHWGQAGRSVSLTNQVNNTIRNTQRTSSLHTATQLNNLGLQLRRRHIALPISILLAASLLPLQPRKVLLRQVHKARPYILPYQIPSRSQRALDGNLHLQLARAEPQVHDRLASPRLAVLGRRVRARVAPDTGLVLLHLVVARDAQVNLALADEGRDVGGGEEHERDREVLDERDVETVFAPELDIGAFEEVEGGLLEAALWESLVSTGVLIEGEGGGCPDGLVEGKPYSWARRRATGLLGFGQVLVGSVVSSLLDSKIEGNVLGRGQKAEGGEHWDGKTH